jgi:hypothetical protein
MIQLTFKRTHFLRPFLALILILAPLVANLSAQDFDDGSSHKATTSAGKETSSTYADARADAERDVESDVSGGGWFAAGFLCGPFGWLFAYLSDSKPPVSRIMGKDSDYVLAYSSEYESKAKGTKTSKSLIGCLVGSVISIVIQVAIISSSSSSSNN